MGFRVKFRGCPLTTNSRESCNGPVTACTGTRSTRRTRLLELWVRRKRGNRKLECSGCGRKFSDAHDCSERAVRDLPWSEFKTTVHIEVYRVKCPDCGVKVEKVPLLPSKAPFSKRFEDAVGQACESAAARQVARRFGLAGDHGARDRSALPGAMGRHQARSRRSDRWGWMRFTGARSDKFLTVVSNLETGEPLWFGKERKKETLDEFFRTQLRSGQRKRIEAACVDMWEPFRLSIEQWAPGCRIVYDKFHIIQHANDAVDEVRRAEFFRKGRKMRDVIKGKKWLLLSRWKNLAPSTARRPEPAVPVEPASVQSLPAQRESGTAVGLPLRGSHAQLPAEVDGSTAVAAPALVSETRRDAAQAPRRNSELLPDQGALRSRRGHQWQHPHADQPRPRLQEHALSATESKAHGRHQHRIRRFSENRKAA